MSNYTPQVGDRVRRTYPDGTIVEGVIAYVHAHQWAGSESGITLYNPEHPEQTELLNRPFTLNTEPGAVYGDPANPAHRVVRVAGQGKEAWLGYVGDDDYHWYEDAEILGYITDAGWIEFNLDGSRKSE